MALKFGNGSEIRGLSFKSNTNQRGNRSSIIGFHCINCNIYHELHWSKILIIDDDIWMCRAGFEKIIEPYINNSI